MRFKDVMNSFGKTKEAKQARVDLTQEDRDLIIKWFPENNAGERDLHNKDAYLFPDGANAVYENLSLAFYRLGDTPRVSIGIYAQEADPSNPRTSPLTHRDVEASEDILGRIRAGTW